ncbi:hypothetical protein BT67DRAFT_306845 [Trichocladium antarcticum]|uniref:Uncharacterized protein n=1 Tax=Trichocladium antarcticum TaxID=1450529 RepID=A0AAN6UJK8_9PEZI|nr:hypothetical protein BT67DRAFT_306845 [Trichocladium antarcticum]
MQATARLEPGSRPTTAGGGRSGPSSKHHLWGLALTTKQAKLTSRQTTHADAAQACAVCLPCVLCTYIAGTVIADSEKVTLTTASARDADLSPRPNFLPFTHTRQTFRRGCVAGDKNTSTE